MKLTEIYFKVEEGMLVAFCGKLTRVIYKKEFIITGSVEGRMSGTDDLFLGIMLLA